MDYNTFNYKSYVEQHYRYNETQWPPNVALAELHSRCSMPGDLTQNDVECPCCHEKTKESNTSWFGKNIYQDFTGTSSGICGYFLLLRSYVLISFLLVCIGSIYQLIEQYNYCNNLDTGLCYKEFFI
jgi:hypothetical protein